MSGITMHIDIKERFRILLLLSVSNFNCILDSQEYGFMQWLSHDQCGVVKHVCKRSNLPYHITML